MSITREAGISLVKKAFLYTLLCAFALSPIRPAAGQQNGGNGQTESVPVFGIGQ
jgi:hypothetical protein